MFFVLKVLLGEMADNSPTGPGGGTGRSSWSGVRGYVQAGTHAVQTADDSTTSPGGGTGRSTWVGIKGYVQAGTLDSDRRISVESVSSVRNNMELGHIQ